MALLEGRNAVLEALRAGRPLREVLVARGARRTGALGEIVRHARDRDVPMREVARRELDEVSPRGAHQGVVAHTSGFAYAELHEVLEAQADEPHSAIVVLDHVTDPGNLGAAVRSVECLGGAAVVIPRRRAASMDSVAMKASAGAAEHVPVVRVVNVARALEELKEWGYWVAGASERGTEDVMVAPIEGRMAFVSGAEGEGLTRLVRERCDLLVRIPMAGRIPSLNVAQAVTVLMYEHARRRARADTG